MTRLALATAVALASQSALAQTWCGKNYMEGSPIVPPGGQFPAPAASDSPLLAFRCSPAIKPYLAEDASGIAAILIDTPVTYFAIDGAVPITLPAHGDFVELAITVSASGRFIAGGFAPLNATKVELPFSLLELAPQTTPYELECAATYFSLGAPLQTFTSVGALSYLPDPPDGRSVTKMDFRTGAMLAKPATGLGGSYEPVLPIGFYTGFDDFFISNLSNINTIKELGYTVIHPIPPYDNITGLLAAVERMEELGIYLMYDMRWTYQNLTAVAEEVNRIKNSPALLLWYTGDEPDGTSDPLNATTIAYDLIYELDGYHPVSLCLNCENYYWTNYSNGADIVMQDAYSIGNNVTWSSQWNTACTPDYGDCGCDNCKGDFEDISTRIDEFHYRMFVNGWDRTKSVMTVPQGFGHDTYWPVYPTGQQWVVQSVVGINHGAVGVVSWDMPDETTQDILEHASLLAKASVAFAPYVLSPSARFAHVFSNQIDIGLWTVAGKTLVLATNLNYAAETFDLDSVAGLATSPAVQILDAGATLNGSVINFVSTGAAGFILG